MAKSPLCLTRLLRVTLGLAVQPSGRLSPSASSSKPGFAWRFAAGAGSAPVPPTVTRWGLPGALDAILIVAVRFPVAAGLKVNRIVQLAPAASVVPQSVVCVQS